MTKAKEKSEKAPAEKAEEEAKEGLDLALADEAKPELPPVTEEVEVYRRMELEDERQILDELQGRALDTMLYSFESGGRTQTGFSWKGCREAVRTLNARGWTRIRMSPEIRPEFEETTDGEGAPAIRCVVYAEDTQNGGGNWGVAVQPKKMAKRNGEKVLDPFAQHKALSKAQRNAFEPLIPLEAVEYLKAQYLGRPDQVKVIPGAGRAVEVEAPKPLDTPEAKEKLDEMRRVYDEIKAIDRIVMPPGQFNAVVRGAQHDLDRLNDELAALVAFKETEEEIAALRERVRQAVPAKAFEREWGKMAGLSQQKRLVRWKYLVEEAEKGGA